MDIIETGVNIGKIWNAFFWPFVEFTITFIVIYFLFGKELWNYYFNKILIKKDGILFKFKKSKGMYIPVSVIERNIFDKVVSNHLFAATVILLLVYSINRLISFTANYFPIVFYFRGDNLLLLSLERELLAHLWAYFPNEPLYSVYNKIELMAREHDYFQYDTVDQLIYNVRHLFQFICILSVMFGLFVIFSRLKSKCKRILKALLVVSMSLIFIIITYFVNTYHMTDVTNSKASYAVSQFDMDEDIELYTKNVEVCLEKIERLYAKEDTQKVFGIRFDLKLNLKKAFRVLEAFEVKY